MSTTTATPGEKNLQTLICTLKTTLHPSTFVFLTLPPTHTPPPTLFIQMTFREIEGLTIITTQESAIEHEMQYIFPCRMITLDVHSSLEAVGFIAAVSRRLTERGIGVNPVSGFFHDHCCVPVGREEEAMECLREMVEDAKGD